MRDIYFCSSQIAHFLGHKWMNSSFFALMCSYYLSHGGRQSRRPHFCPFPLLRLWVNYELNRGSDRLLSLLSPSPSPPYLSGPESRPAANSFQCLSWLPAPCSLLHSWKLAGSKLPVVCLHSAAPLTKKKHFNYSVAVKGAQWLFSCSFPQLKLFMRSFPKNPLSLIALFLKSRSHFFFWRAFFP